MEYDPSNMKTIRTQWFWWWLLWKSEILLLVCFEKYYFYIATNTRFFFSYDKADLTKYTKDIAERLVSVSLISFHWQYQHVWKKTVSNPNFGCSGTPLLIVDKGEGNLGHLAQTFSLSRCGVVHNLSSFVVFSDRFLRMDHLIQYKLPTGTVE